MGLLHMETIFRMHIIKTAIMAAICSVVCISFATPQCNEVGTQAQGRVALFVDKGSYGNGMHHWLRLLEYSPQVQLDFVYGKAIRDGSRENLRQDDGKSAGRIANQALS